MVGTIHIYHILIKYNTNKSHCCMNFKMSPSSNLHLILYKEQCMEPYNDPYIIVKCGSMFS